MGKGSEPSIGLSLSISARSCVSCLKSSHTASTSNILCERSSTCRLHTSHRGCEHAGDHTFPRVFPNNSNPCALSHQVKVAMAGAIVRSLLCSPLSTSISTWTRRVSSASPIHSLRPLPDPTATAARCFVSSIRTPARYALPCLTRAAKRHRDRTRLLKQSNIRVWTTHTWLCGYRYIAEGNTASPPPHALLTLAEW